MKGLEDPENGEEFPDCGNKPEVLFKVCGEECDGAMRSHREVEETTKSVIIQSPEQTQTMAKD